MQPLVGLVREITVPTVLPPAFLLDPEEHLLADYALELERLIVGDGLPVLDPDSVGRLCATPEREHDGGRGVLGVVFLGCRDGFDTRGPQTVLEDGDARDAPDSFGTDAADFVENVAGAGLGRNEDAVGEEAHFAFGHVGGQVDEGDQFVCHGGWDHVASVEDRTFDHEGTRIRRAVAVPDDEIVRVDHFLDFCHFVGRLEAGCVFGDLDYFCGYWLTVNGSIA